MKKITTIVITGGPCAGKTSALEWLRENYSGRGYGVIFVPETCTEMMAGGLYPWNCGGNVNFQKCLVALQQFKEHTFRRAAQTMEPEHTLVFCDRAAFDNRAYMTDQEFQEVLADLHTDEATLLGEYDGVFHLTSVACGDQDLYSTATNVTRYEDKEGAAALDAATRACWEHHPYFRVIPLAPTFEEKMETLKQELDRFLQTVG
jgi:hypothetical protein